MGFLEYIGWIIFIVSLISLGWMSNTLYKEDLVSAINQVNCNDTNLENYLNCLRNDLDKWYIYNVSNLYLFWNNETGEPDKINWDTIKEQGGVCWHFAEWYRINSKEKGFYAKRVFIEMPPSDHSIAIISDNSTYCIADQTFKIKCNKLNTNQNANN